MPIPWDKLSLEDRLRQYCDHLCRIDKHDDELGCGLFGSNKELQSGVCTTGASLIAKKFHGKVYGYSCGPDDKRVGHMCYGHDFAVVGRYLVDYWGAHVEGSIPDPVIDMEEHPEVVERLYGAPSSWTQVRGNLQPRVRLPEGAADRIPHGLQWEESRGTDDHGPYKSDTSARAMSEARPSDKIPGAWEKYGMQCWRKRDGDVLLSITLGGDGKAAYWSVTEIKGPRPAGLLLGDTLACGKSKTLMLARLDCTEWCYNNVSKQSPADKIVTHWRCRSKSPPVWFRQNGKASANVFELFNPDHTPRGWFWRLSVNDHIQDGSGPCVNRGEAMREADKAFQRLDLQSESSPSSKIPGAAATADWKYCNIPGSHQYLYAIIGTGTRSRKVVVNVMSSSGRILWATYDAYDVYIDGGDAESIGAAKRAAIASALPVTEDAPADKIRLPTLEDIKFHQSRDGAYSQWKAKWIEMGRHPWTSTVWKFVVTFGGVAWGYWIASHRQPYSSLAAGGYATHEEAERAAIQAFRHYRGSHVESAANKIPGGDPGVKWEVYRGTNFYWWEAELHGWSAKVYLSDAGDVHWVVRDDHGKLKHRIERSNDTVARAKKAAISYIRDFSLGEAAPSNKIPSPLQSVQWRYHPENDATYERLEGHLCGYVIWVWKEWSSHSSTGYRFVWTATATGPGYHPSYAGDGRDFEDGKQQAVRCIINGRKKGGAAEPPRPHDLDDLLD